MFWPAAALAVAGVLGCHPSTASRPSESAPVLYPGLLPSAAPAQRTESRSPEVDPPPALEVQWIAQPLADWLQREQLDIADLFPRAPAELLSGLREARGVAHLEVRFSPDRGAEPPPVKRPASQVGSEPRWSLRAEHRLRNGSSRPGCGASMSDSDPAGCVAPTWSGVSAPALEARVVAPETVWLRATLRPGLWLGSAAVWRRRLEQRLVAMLGPKPLLDEESRERWSQLLDPLAADLAEAFGQLDPVEVRLSPDGAGSLVVLLSPGSALADDGSQSSSPRALPSRFWKLPLATGVAASRLDVPVAPDAVKRFGAFWAALFRFRGLPPPLQNKLERWSAQITLPPAIGLAAEGALPIARAPRPPRFLTWVTPGAPGEAARALREATALLQDPQLKLQVERVLSSVLRLTGTRLSIRGLEAVQGAPGAEAVALTLSGTRDGLAQRRQYFLGLAPAAPLEALANVAPEANQAATVWVWTDHAQGLPLVLGGGPPLSASLAARRGLRVLVDSRVLAGGFVTASALSWLAGPGWRSASTPWSWTVRQGGSGPEVEVRLTGAALREWRDVAASTSHRPPPRAHGGHSAGGYPFLGKNGTGAGRAGVLAPGEH